MPSRTKRKSTSPVDSKHDNKKTKNSSSSRQHHPLSQEAEKHGIVLRKYYPPEMSNARAQAYADEEIQRPIEELQAALEETAKERESVKPSKSVIHWFKMDLRHTDNTALALASQKAQDAGVPLICVYLLSPQDFEAHLLSPARVDFMLRSIAVLQKDLDKLDIPLHIETVEQRSKIPDRMLELMDQWGASHVFANMEYEVDELRREAYMVRDLSENGKSFEVVHDTCVVPPGSLQTGTGKQYAVYSPWYRAWVAHIHGNLDLLELHEPPAANPKSARKDFSKLFGCAIPAAPKSKALGAEDKKRLEALWPAGEHEALARLDTFCKKKIGGYADTRSTPSADGTSCISVHLASGTISSRTCVRTARDRNTTKKLNGGKDGVASWISEVAWRDFYRHVLASWPYVCMNKPYKPAYSNIAWSYDTEHFAAWCEGRTGFPIVDAAMRQLNHTGYMHNRCRMIVASFLSKDLLIDWRMGERYFMEHLVDGDFASNNGGWGFSASVGVDPQPYFRIFNPLLQSERFDPDGEYIRKWVPELAEVEGKAIHEPYGRGAGDEARKAGYPEQIVEHKGCRERALSAYKDGLDSGL